MKIRSINIAIIIYLFFFISNLSAIENKILAKVDNEIITTIDIFNENKYSSLLNTNFKILEKEKAYEISKNSLVKFTKQSPTFNPTITPIAKY